MKNFLPRFISQRIVLAVLSLVAVAGIYVLQVRFFGGDLRQYELSPDAKKIAQVREYDQSSATTTNLISVELRTKFNPFRHTVLAGLDYGAEISVTWVDSRNLLVRCIKCSSFDVKCDSCGSALYVVGKDTKWRDVSIQYSTE